MVARKLWITADGRGGLKDQEFHNCTMHVRCKSWASFGSEGSVEVQDHFFSRRSVQKCFLHWGETITLNGYVHSFREKVVQPQKFSPQSKGRALQFIYQRCVSLRAMEGRHPTIPVRRNLWANQSTKQFLLCVLCWNNHITEF